METEIRSYGASRAIRHTRVAITSSQNYDVEFLFASNHFNSSTDCVDGLRRTVAHSTHRAAHSFPSCLRSQWQPDVPTSDSSCERSARSNVTLNQQLRLVGEKHDDN